MAMKPNGFKPMRGKSLTMNIGAAKPMPKPAKPLPKMTLPGDKPKPKPSYGYAPPVTQRELDRAPEANDVLMARRGSNIIRTTVRERPTPTKKGK